MIPSIIVVATGIQRGEITYPTLPSSGVRLSSCSAQEIHMSWILLLPGFHSVASPLSPFFYSISSLVTETVTKKLLFAKHLVGSSIVLILTILVT